MRALFVRIRDVFRPTEGALILPIGISIDHETMARALKVDTLASAAGKHDLPAPNATSPDNNETRIESYHRELLRALHAWYQDKLKREQGRQEQAAGTFDAKGFEEHRDAALQALTHLAATSRHQLIPGRQEERQACKDLRAFRVQHNVMREADYPASWHWHRALPVAMVMVEAAANSRFFAVGLEGGLVAGVQEALLIAALNVTISFGAGVVLRGLHSPGGRRLVAGAIGGLYGVGLGLYHLAVGHYRTALLSNPDSAAFTAMASFTHAPLALPDFHSWLLTLVGVLFGLGAAMSGYKADDPIPGYGQVTRRFKAAAAAYHSLKEQYLSGIQDVIDTQLDAVDKHLEEARAAMNAYLDSMAETGRLMRDYQLAAAAINDACIAMLQRYRARNMAVRDLPPPAYFAEAIHSPLEDELHTGALPAGTAATQTTTTLKKDLADLQDTVADVKRQLRDLHQMSLNHAPKYFEMIEVFADGSTTNHDGGEASPLEDAV
ncbi:MAG: hypothetical protein HYZ81_25635 [Nitrospinae bacterium]|nr:hypothetical protein [Nitrospinota bacterium]